MAITITQTPAYPKAGTPVRCVVATTAGNWVRVWVVDAPPTSEWRARLDEQGGRVELAAIGAGEAFSFADQAPGRYVLAAQAYTQAGRASGGGYAGSPAGHTTETKEGTEEALYLDYGTRLTTRVGVPPDTATLVVWVWGDTIRPTSMAQHGEVSPAIINAATARAAVAAVASGTTAARAALHNATVEAAHGDPAARLEALVDDFGEHIASETFHATSDADNVVSPGFSGGDGAEFLIRGVTELAVKLSRHIRNDSGGGTGTAAYHDPDDDSLPDTDWANVPTAVSAGDLPSALSLLASIESALRAHRVSDVHNELDEPAALDVTGLGLLRYRFTEAARQDAPDAPDTVGPGAALLIHGEGFAETI